MLESCWSDKERSGAYRVLSIANGLSVSRRAVRRKRARALSRAGGAREGLKQDEVAVSPRRH
jgi:hypothetical protein